MKKLLMLLLCALCLLTAASALAEETALGAVLDRVFSPEALYTPEPTQTPRPTGTPRPAEPLPTTEAYRNDEKTIVNGEGGMYNIILDDEECLLSDEEKEALLPVMRQISRYGTVAFYTTDRSGSVDNKAMAYFDRNISRSSLYSGVIFMIDMNARQIYIFSRGEIEKYVTRSDAYAITADVSSYATAGDYFTCANEAYQRILGNLEGQRM